VDPHFSAGVPVLIGRSHTRGRCLSHSGPQEHSWRTRHRPGRTLAVDVPAHPGDQVHPIAQNLVFRPSAVRTKNCPCIRCGQIALMFDIDLSDQAAGV